MDEKDFCPYCKEGILTTVITPFDPNMDYPKYCSNIKCAGKMPKINVAGTSVVFD